MVQSESTDCTGLVYRQYRLCWILNAMCPPSSRILSARELRTLLTHVEGSRHIDADAIDRFQWLLGNCSLNYTGVTPQPSEEEFQTLYDPSFVSGVYILFP